MSVGSRLLLPPHLGRAGQRLPVSSEGSRSLLWHVGFPCPRALGCLLRTGCVGFPPLCHLRCHKRVGSIGFRSLAFLAALMFSGSLTGSAPAQLFSIFLLLYCTSLSRRRRVSPSYPGHLYLDFTVRSWSRTLRGWQARLPWSSPVISWISSGFPPLL